MNTCTRIFLGWIQPPPFLAAEWFLSLAHSSALDLSSTIVVVPGARAGRVLLGMLVARTQERGLAFSPPLFVTPGELADTILLPCARTQPGPMITKLAWIEALRSLSSEDLAGLIPLSLHDPADLDRIESWTGIAHSLRQCHDDLCTESLHFARVPELAASLPHFEEQERWIAAQRIQARYAQVLQSWGHADPALNRIAADTTNRNPAINHVVMVGITELASIARRALTIPGLKVTSLIMAPDAENDAFDSLGTLLVPAWARRHISISPHQIEFAEYPAEQAECALGFLASLEPSAPFEVAVGVPDPSVVPALERSGAQAGINLRAATGDLMTQTPPGRLLLLTLAYLNARTWSSLTDLLRHPDFEQTLERLSPEAFTRCAGIRTIEAFRRDSLCNELGNARTTHEAAEIQRHVEELLGGLVSPQKQPLTQWPAEIMRLLARVYADVPLDPRCEAERLVVEACRMIKSQLAPLARHESAGPELTAREFLTLFFEENRDANLPPALAPDAVELLGWLELWMDPSRFVVVTGMNESMVPPSTTADPLLPNALRVRLGLPCDESRLAREVYLATHLLHSRERILFVAGRRAADGTPLVPSRLLFAAGKSEVAARLALLSKAETPAHPRRVALLAQTAPGINGFTARVRIDARIPTELSVTAFKQYINSPYRFYLEHVLRLSEQHEAGLEMDHGQFGDLVHRALHAFAKGPGRNASRASDITEALMHALDIQVALLHGEQPTTPVWLQIESARRRLQAFALRQAEHREQGWTIAFTEWIPSQGVQMIEVDGAPFGLRGRIDRIDRHPDGRIAILDYKTSDRPVKAESALSSKGEWLDLQLPLYRHLINEILPPRGLEQVVLGYITLPRESEETAIVLPEWTGPDFNLADKLTHEVIRAIRRGEFDDIGSVYPTGGSLDALCGIGILGVEPPAIEESK